MKDVIKNQELEEQYSSSARRRNRSRGGMKGYCAIAFVFVSIIVLILCLTVLFKVHTVEIEGLTLYREDQIISVGGINDGENLVRTDTKTIEKRLVDNLVFIDSAKVEKKYPSTLVVTLKEAEKIADIKYDGGYCVVSGSDRILEVGNDKVTGEIPVITGFDLSSKKIGDKLSSDDEQKVKILEEILKITEELDFDNITDIDLTSRSGIVITYDGRIRLEVGSSVDLDYKLNYFKAVIDNKLTGDFKGKLLFNGTDSGISAIPDDSSGNTEPSSDSSQATSADSSQAEAETETDTTYVQQPEQTDDTAVTTTQPVQQTEYTTQTQTTENTDYGADYTQDNLDLGYGY